MTRQEFMRQLQTGLLGPSTDYGGLLDQGSLDAARRSGMMNFGTALLAAGGPSREPVSLGQALGSALQHGRAAQSSDLQNSVQQKIMMAQLNAKKGPIAVAKDTVLIDPETNQPVFSNVVPTTPKPNDPLSQLEADFNSGLIREPDYLARKKLLTTPRQGTTVNVNTGDKLGAAMAGKVAEQYATQYDSAQLATESIASSERVRQLLKATPYTGTGAEWKLAVGKAAKAAGFDYAGDDIANTELLAKELGQNVLNNVKSSGLAGSQGLTEGERKFLLQVVGGTITLDDKTLAKIADLNERVARNSIKKWNATTKRLPKDMLDQLGMGPIEEAKDGGDMGNGWSIVQ